MPRAQVSKIGNRHCFDRHGNETFDSGLFGGHHGGHLHRVRHRQMEGAAQALAYPGECAAGVGCLGRQCRGVVGDAGVASQDPAQEVQVRRAGDICRAGGGGGLAADKVNS